jgi:hypothetical protein
VREARIWLDQTPPCWIKRRAPVAGLRSPSRGLEQAIAAFPIIAATLSLVAGIYVFATTTAMVVHGWSAIPYWDQWDELILNAKQILSSSVYNQHNEHRLLFPRLIFAVDTFYFGEANRFTFFCNLILPSGLAGLIIFVAHRHISQSITDSTWIAGIIVTFVFSAMQSENFLWGFQVQFFGVELAVVGAIACLVLGNRGWPSLVFSIILEAIALYTLASGVVAVVLAIPLAVWANRSRFQTVVLIAAAVVLVASYLHGYEAPSGQSYFVAALTQRLIPYTAAELGNPFGQIFRKFHSAHFIGWDVGFGLFGLVIFIAVTLFYLRRRREVANAQLFFIGTAAFAVGVTFLTAVARAKLGLEQALSSRYASPMLLFWLSMAMVGVIESRGRRNWRLVAMVLSLPCLLGFALVQSSFVKAGLAWVLPRREAVTALLSDVNDHDALMFVYPDAAGLREKAAKLKALHLAIFSDPWSGWLGTPLADHVRLGDPSECRGGIDEITRLSVPGRAQWRVSGWAWDDPQRSSPERVIIADSTGRVVGYGLGGYPTELGSAGPKHSGWHGHFAAENGGPVTAYALVDRERTACPLGR